MKSKDRIIFEAFKLFCQKPYDQVTFADIEVATNLSRGAILYHFKAKEIIFNRVIETYVLSTNSITEIDVKKQANLQEFINAFLEQLKENKLQMKKWGIKNMNIALLHIESSAYTFYQDMQDKAKKWYDEQLEVWETVLANATESNEIRTNINIKVIARLFETIYIGSSFLGVTNLQGIEVEELQEDFQSLYEFLK